MSEHWEVMCEVTHTDVAAEVCKVPRHEAERWRDEKERKQSDD